MATRGYNSYRGRVSTGRIVLIVVLVLVLLGAIGYLAVQNYLVYDEAGQVHLELPWAAAIRSRSRPISRRWKMWTSIVWSRRAS